MVDGYGDLGSLHIDVLREIGSIGAGNALTALGKMLNRTVRMSVPVVNLLDFDKIADSVGGPEKIIIGILVNISGDINGIMMFIVGQESAHSLINILMGTDQGAEEGFSEMELSALQEIGNILASSYLASLSSLIQKKVVPSVPYLAIDMANAILSVPAIEFGKVGDKVLFIESVFGDEKTKVSGYFLLIPDMPSFNLILSSLGVV